MEPARPRGADQDPDARRHLRSGSWDPSNPRPDHWGEAAGRLFQTSLSILTLEVYYRYLPLYRTADSEGLEAAAAPAAEKKAPDLARKRK